MTKRILSMLLLASGIASASALFMPDANSTNNAAYQMRWEHDLRRSLDQARGSNRLILIDIYSDWCHWCKVLDKDVYSDPQVASYLNSNFVCVKVNADDPTLGKWVKIKYDVVDYPAILMLRDKETVVGRIGGFEPKNQFMNHIRFFQAQAQHAAPTQ